jgi:hypothetical protein
VYQEATAAKAAGNPPFPHLQEYSLENPHVSRYSLQGETFRQQEIKHVDKLTLTIFQLLRLSFINCKHSTNCTSPTGLHSIHVRAAV